MGRQPCCDKVGLKKGPWTVEEDKKLINFILSNGQCCWRAVPKLAGLLRCGKSCRLRWTNYLRPDLKRGLLADHEEQLVIDLHAQLGNRWSKIASHMPGRTDNEIKNHWNTHIKKKLRKMGIDPLTHKPLSTQPPKTSDHFGHETQKQQPRTDHTMSSSSPKSTISTEKIVSESDGGDDADTLQIMDGFCTDEVPLIQPHEILVPPTSSTSSSSSTSTSSSLSSPSISAALEEYLRFPDFDWSDFEKNSDALDGGDLLWVNDDFVNGLDLLVNDGDGNDRGNYVISDGSLQRMVLEDQESSWVYGLL